MLALLLALCFYTYHLNHHIYSSTSRNYSHRSGHLNSSHSNSHSADGRIIATNKTAMHKSSYRIISYRQRYIDCAIMHITAENILASSTTLMLKLVHIIYAI